MLSRLRIKFNLPTPKAFYKAINDQDLRQVKKLLNNRHNPNIPYDNTYPLFQAVSVNNNNEILNTLIRYKNINLFINDEEGSNLLHYAAINNNFELVNFLLERDFDINASNNHQNRPLTLALSNEHYDMAEHLIHKGARVDVEDLLQSFDRYNSSLFETLLNDISDDIINKNLLMILYTVILRDGVVDYINILYECFPKKFTSIINKSKSKYNGQTPLHEAVNHGSNKIVKRLLTLGANPNKVDCDGQTPLHEAVNHGSLKLVECLLNFNANKLIKDNGGNTPEMIAVWYKYYEIASYIHNHLDVKEPE